MRPGQDRHDLAAEVMGLLYPEDVGFLRGITLGERSSDIGEREGRTPRPDGPGAALDYEVTDPLSHGRTLTLKFHQQQGRASTATAFFVSQNRMDVDSVYRLVRKHLQACHGRPSKQMTGVLKFIWRHDGELPTETSVCRYKNNDTGENILEVATRLADGVRITGHNKPGS